MYHYRIRETGFRYFDRITCKKMSAWKT